VIQRQNADPACAISSASGKRQPMTTQFRICRSSKFVLDLNTGRGNLSGVNKIAALIDHYAFAAWKKCMQRWLIAALCPWNGGS